METMLQGKGWTVNITSDGMVFKCSEGESITTLLDLPKGKTYEDLRASLTMNCLNYSQAEVINYLNKWFCCD